MINASKIRGAYGRKYETLEQAKKDWDAGLDFVILGLHTCYCSKRDFDLLDSVYIELKTGYEKIN